MGQELLSKLIWLLFSALKDSQMKSKQIEAIVLQPSKNFSFLSMTYFQFLASRIERMKLKGSYRPNPWSRRAPTAKKRMKNSRRAIIHVTSTLAILWGCLCLTPHKNCKYSYYFFLTSACYTLWGSYSS